VADRAGAQEIVRDGGSGKIGSVRIPITRSKFAALERQLQAEFRDARRASRKRRDAGKAPFSMIGYSW